MSFRNIKQATMQILAMMLAGKSAMAQLGIGIPTPHASAGLEILSTNKGLLIPRVSLVGPTDGNAVPFGSVQGLWVYNTNASMAGGSGVGFYYNANEGNPGFYNWVKMQPGISSALTWNTNGNTGVNSASNFIGTTDNQPLVFGAGLILNTQSVRKQGFLIPQKRSYYFNNVPASLTAQGEGRIGIGFQALNNANPSSGMIGIGRRAGSSMVGSTPGDNTVAIGDSAFSNYTRSIGGVFVGAFSGHDALEGGAVVGIGFESLFNTGSGVNSAFGSMAMRNVFGAYTENGLPSSGGVNLAIGYEALRNGGLVQDNTMVGYRAGYAISSSRFFGATVGVGSGVFNPANETTNVLNSVAVGYQALALGRTSNQNVAIGTEALTNCSVCTSSVAVGYQALHSMISAGQNTAIGAVAADNMSGTTLNTALGVGALGEVSNGQLNTAVGFLAYPTGNFSNSTVLGYFRGVNASNQVRIGNASVSSIGGQVGWTALSDLRAKSDIMEDVPGWEFIQHLLPVTYHINREFIDGFDKDGKLRSHYQVPLAEADPALHTGLEAGKVLSAAQHHEGLKSIVDTQSGKDGLLGLRYGLLVVPLVKTIQQQQTTIREIENLIAQLEETLTLLK